jgi:signal transduction histidine kinase
MLKEAAKKPGTASYVKKHKATIGDAGKSELRELAHNLGERIKELNCLYGISRLVEQENTTIDEIMQNVVDLIPPAWQYPEDTCARIKLEDREFQTSNFRETAWYQSEVITVNGQASGNVQVYYLSEKPRSDEGPFLKEERTLIHAIAERLGHIVEHKRAAEELQLLYEQERQLREKLQAEMQARVELTRNLIHELKTPLTALMATSQLLSDETEGSELGRLAQHICEGANSLNNRINELHDVVRGEIGKLKMEFKQIDLKKLLTSLMEETHALARQNRVSIDLKLEENIPVIYADPARIQQVLLNLLNNAFKYASEGKRVTIIARRDADYVVVEVRDYGPGIAPEEQRNIFQPGYQLVYAGGRSGGLGIGLALCKILVKLHGGRIWLESKPGKGSSFFFTLPLQKSKN